MWLSLSPKLVNVDFPQDNNAIAAVENIWASFFRGEHIVFSDRNTLTHLLNIGLTQPSQASIRSVLAKYSELCALEQQQIFRVFVDPEIDQPNFKKSNTWNIPLKHFSNFALVPSCILSENLRDTIAYERCGIHALKKSGGKGVKINLIKDSGGGSDISNKLLDLETSRRNFVLVITDTDKTHPDSEACIPTKRCREIAENSSWVISHKELPCSEIENLLPVNLVSDSIENSQAIHELNNQLDYLKDNVFNNLKIHKWFDIKNGTKLARKKHCNTNTVERQYWENSTKSVVTGYDCKPECIERHECVKPNANECECLFIPGLGDQTLERFNKYCSTLTIPKQLERINTSSNASDWLELGSVVASWGAALDRQRC